VSRSHITFRLGSKKRGLLFFTVELSLCLSLACVATACHLHWPLIRKEFRMSSVWNLTRRLRNERCACSSVRSASAV